MLRSIFFQSEKCYGQFDAKSLHEKKFTITAQLWTKWWLSENGCSKNANLTSVQGHVRPHFAASWWKVLGAFFVKTAFSQVIFYSILCQKWMYQAKLKICFGLRVCSEEFLTKMVLSWQFSVREYFLSVRKKKKLERDAFLNFFCAFCIANLQI